MQQIRKLVQKGLLLMMVVGLVACVPANLPVGPTPTPMEPLTIVGRVMDVAASARVITLSESVAGISAIALTDETVLQTADGQTLTLQDLRPGLVIEATGRVGYPGSLIASQVRVLAEQVATTPAPVAGPPEGTPTVPAAQTPTPASAQVVASALNVRTGPSTAYPVITAVRRGTELTVLGQNKDGSWLQVRLPDGRTGWVARAYTDFQGVVPVVEPPPLPITPTPQVITGWRGEYFANRDLVGAPSLVRMDPNINFNWGYAAPAATLPADNFSVRWTRSLTLPRGTYRFYAISNDGVRLWLDGQLLIDQWHEATDETYWVEWALDGAPHEFRVEYFDAVGPAQIQFWWERLGEFPQWRGEYFANPNLTGEPVLVRNDVVIDFQWGGGAPAPEVPRDEFSVRWSRTLPFDEGLYRFKIVVDDGARLYVDGNLLIDEWRDGGERRVEAERRLSAGNHTIRLEYYERGGTATIRLAWEQVTAFPDWRGEYWSNPRLEGEPVLVRNDRSINFEWGLGSPAGNVPNDHFSARWTRTAEFEGATYRFHLIVDDGARLWIDDKLVIDEWRGGPAREVAVDYPLTQGPHWLRLEYFEVTADARIRLWWEKVATVAFPDWKGEYWANPFFNGAPTVVTNDENIDFYWGADAPKPGLPADHFAVRWSRQVVFEPGVYRFYARADDGIRFFVDGDLVLDEWHDSSGDQIYTVDLTLSGPRWLVVEYYENAGVALVRFWWEKIGSL